ncbi:hypothetical protein CFIMG_003049RA [Ceratocystis fimbriata CBS 114723]|uniref:Uncharacterized protein n=1 Tax=Ceratocystis fimbriata CBS 114723 TaxID=1035309 RepID=A0A2C5XBJ0_9PEZI|nr:hypothetical protein CFIMG_003049RA [Ceratocystis fimbriata CBS 114723]
MAGSMNSSRNRQTTMISANIDALDSPSAQHTKLRSQTLNQKKPPTSQATIQRQPKMEEATGDSEMEDTKVALGNDENASQCPLGQNLSIPAHPRLVEVMAMALAVLSNLGGWWIGYTLLQEWAKPQLAGVVYHPQPEELGWLIGWRVFYTASAWLAACDAADIAAMGVLGASPTMYLLATFYHVPPFLALLALAIEFLVVFVSWGVFRGWSETGKCTNVVRSKHTVTSDFLVQIATTSFAAAIYGVILFFAFQSFAPRLVLEFFTGGQVVTTAYPFGYITILPAALICGTALNWLVFVPYVDIGLRPEDEELACFNPSTATLWETIVFNFWGYTTRIKVGLGRILAAMLSSGVGTCMLLQYGLKTTYQGAVAYSSIWVVAALLAGIGMGYTGKL